MGVLDKYKHKWPITIVLLLALANIFRLIYGLAEIMMDISEKDSFIDVVETGSETPYILLLNYYALIIGFVLARIKQIDRNIIYPILISVYIVLSTLFIDPMFIDFFSYL